jgi:hypothetical protein
MASCTSYSPGRDAKRAVGREQVRIVVAIVRAVIERVRVCVNGLTKNTTDIVSAVTATVFGRACISFSFLFGYVTEINA